MCPFIYLLQEVSTLLTSSTVRISSHRCVLRCCTACRLLLTCTYLYLSVSITGICHVNRSQPDRSLCAHSPVCMKRCSTRLPDLTLSPCVCVCVCVCENSDAAPAVVVCVCVCVCSYLPVHDASEGVGAVPMPVCDAGFCGRWGLDWTPLDWTDPCRAKRMVLRGVTWI